MTALAEHVLFLDWKRPPLTENQRLNHWQRASIVRDTRSVTGYWARRIGRVERVRVQLVWVVGDKRRRDEDNLVPTLKALCDGIVDAGVVPDDTPQYMVKPMPVIEYRKGARAHMLLRVSVLDPNLD